MSDHRVRRHRHHPLELPEHFGKCFDCEEYGHWANDCPNRYDSRRPIRHRTPPKRYSPYSSRRSDEYDRSRSFRFHQRFDPDRHDRSHDRSERRERRDGRNYDRYKGYKRSHDLDDSSDLDESYKEYRKDREERKNKVKSAKKSKLDKSVESTCLERYVHFKKDTIKASGDALKEKKTKKKSTRKISLLDKNENSVVTKDFVLHMLLEKVFGDAQENSEY